MITYELFQAIEPGDYLTIIDRDDSRRRLFGVATARGDETTGRVEVKLFDGRAMTVTLEEVTRVGRERTSPAKKYVLLVENPQEALVGVQFDSPEGARRWEEEHEYDMTARGLVRIVTAHEAIEGAKA